MAHPSGASTRADLQTPDASGSESFRLLGGNRQCCRVVKWLPQTNALAVGGDDGIVRVYPEKGHEYPPLKTSHERVYGILETKRDILLTCGQDGVCLWDLKHGPSLITQIEELKQDQITAMHQLGPTEAMVGTKAGMLAVVQWGDDNKLEITRKFDSIHNARINDVHGYENTIAAVSKDYTATFFTRGSAVLMRKTVRSTAPLYSVSVCSSLIGVGSRNFFRLYRNQAPAYQVVTNVHVQEGLVSTLRFIADELIVLGVGGMFNLITTRGRQEFLRTTRTPSKYIQDIELHPSGSVALVGAGKGGNVFVELPDNVAGEVKKLFQSRDRDGSYTMSRVFGGELRRKLRYVEGCEFVPQSFSQAASPCTSEPKSFVLLSEFDRLQKSKGQGWNIPLIDAKKRPQVRPGVNLPRKTANDGCTNQGKVNLNSGGHFEEVACHIRTSSINEVYHSDLSIEKISDEQDEGNGNLETSQTPEMEPRPNVGASSSESKSPINMANLSLDVEAISETEQVAKQDESKEEDNAGNNSKGPAQKTDPKAEGNETRKKTRIHGKRRGSSKAREDFSLISCMAWMSYWRIGEMTLERMGKMGPERLGDAIAGFMLKGNDKWKELYHPLRKCLFEFFDWHMLLATDIMGKEAIDASEIVKDLRAALEKAELMHGKEELMTRFKDLLAEFDAE